MLTQGQTSRIRTQHAGCHSDQGHLVMEKVLENIAALVKEHPKGIPVKTLFSHYNKRYLQNLSAAQLGFSSTTELIASLDEDLVVVGKRVFHRENRGQSEAGSGDEYGAAGGGGGGEVGGARAKTPTVSKNTTKDLNKVVKMLKKHPGGIPLENIALDFRQMYKNRILDATSLGFNSMSSLIKFLKEDLVLNGNIVFHKSHQPQNQPVGATATEAAECSEPATPQAPASQTLTQDQLYQWVLEVTKKNQLTAPSMQQLQYLYLMQFQEPFPLQQYMSLYSSLEANKVPAQPKPAGEAKKAAARQTPAAINNPAELPPTTGLDFLNGGDFPALGSTAEKKSKVRDVGDGGAAAPVFKEGYHAQLREIHGGNMRAVEAMEEAEDEFAGHTWRGRAMNMDQVNSLIAGVMREIAAEGELVTKEKAVSRLCKFNPSLDPGRLNSRTVPALKDLQYRIREINMYIECTESVTSICTLYELGQSLAGLKDKKRFEELNLGPLCKLPLVHRMFKIDTNTKDDDIHQIETVDILKQLRNFRKKHSKARVDLAEFMKYLADHYNCDSPYELGIRIQGVALPISTIGKVSRNEHAVLEHAREVLQRELEEETLERLRKRKRSILEPIGGAASSSSSIANLELRKKYASMTAAEVVLAVFTNTDGVFSPRMTKHVQSFLLQVSGDRLATALFQLAVCEGSLAAPQDLVPKEKSATAAEQTKAEDRNSMSLPSEAKVKQYLRDSLSAQNSAVTLAHIASLEKKVAKHFQVKDFLSLEKGSFLEFLVKNMQLLQDTLGSALILGSGGSQLASTGFRPSIQDVFEFIKQCGDVTPTDPDELSHVESALKCHYKVRDSRDLGHGPLHKLAGLVQRHRGLPGGELSPVYYQSALLAKHDKLSSEGGCELVGRLGEKSKAQALTSLLSCPLLEDLSQWSQWELIFKPQHGSLKDFIERNAANTGLAAVEVTPGVLLRITTHTGDKHFSSGAEVLDPISTAGHLVSIAVVDGIANTPTALLANHMQSSLAAAVAKEDLSQAEEDVWCYSRAAKFLLTCLTRIPARTCQAFMQQVFLEPFSRVVGQAKSKEVLITVAQSDPKHLNCLHQLGILMGITDWVKDYEKKLDPERRHSYNMSTAPVEQAKSNLIGSQSSSQSALNTSEDEFFEEVLDDGAASSQLNHSTWQANNDQDVEIEEVEEEEEDEEELYELVTPLNGETSDVSSEAEGTQSEQERLEKSDGDEDDAASCRPEVPIDPQRAVIEDIRKSEFGIGVQLNAEGQKLMQVHQERLGRSLDRLSTELYSKDTHFVLELIQNADDNSYSSEAGVTPALAFLVEKDCITVLNNEIGFQEKNIRAICDVGRSTKGKHKYGYIGQKGIGFKSVFKVTDCPEIHSNGFHVRFDKTCGPMGYILPHWSHQERPLSAQLEDLSQHSWTTKIGLPLRCESHQTRNLFHDVHPSLLLFLHRLRSIIIYNQSEKRLVTMTRKDLSHNILEVEHTEGVERWLVVKTTLSPKKIKEDVESTELALAFQLGSDAAGSDTACQPQKQPVFAYLPLRSFGFRFIIQADFDIPSSREDVDRDSSWNQWLRSEIPQLFLQAMDVFTDHPDFTGLKGLCHFLQFVPLPDEVLDFFKPVAGQIIQMLKGKAFLPTRGADDQVVYKLPSQVAVCQDAVIRDVIGGDELERHLSLSYLHPGLSPAPPASLLAHLGVRSLRGSDVTTVTTAMAKELMKVEGIHSDAGLRQLARLLVCNFRALEHGYGEADSVLDTLKELPIIPLADGRAVALSGEGVFFPMEESKTKKKKAQPQKGPLSALYQDVSVVHPSLLNCLEPLESQQVRELLRRLGVHELEPQELLEQHIYPTIRNNSWKSKSESVVVSYLVFIKQHSTSAQDYSDTAIPVLTSRGLLCAANEKVHFSEEYGNIDLPKKLPGYEWTLLSPCYVQTDGDVAGWRELFSRLGVWDGLVIRRERLKLTAADLASSPWSVESTMWPQRPGEGYLLDDYPCEEFHSLATAQLPGSLLLQQRTALLQLLATNWDTGHRYSQYLTAQVIDSEGRPVRSTKSSFHHYLCRLEWVPAYRLQQSGQQERRYLCPSSVYLSSPEVSSLLGTHVDYLDLDASDFSRALGMRETVSVEVLIQYLKEWCVKPQADQQEPNSANSELEGACFTSTVEHIHNVYTYLKLKCSQGSLKELFQHTPAVFVESSKLDDGWSTGSFYHLKEVCWSDPTRVFQRYRRLTQSPDSPVQEPRVLAPFYDPLKDFFIRLLSVDRNPNMNQYVGLLELICSSSPIPTAEVLQDVSVVYARLAQKCKHQVTGDPENTSEPRLNPGYCSTLKGMVSDKRVFPTKDNNWVTLARKPMISDSKELEKIFKPDKRVCLLNLPPADKKTPPKSKTGNKGYAASAGPTSWAAFDEEDRLIFMKICGIRLLSERVQWEPQTENLRPCASMQAMVRSVVPYIQRFLYHHDELGQVYAELIDDNIAAKIKHLSFGQVGKLYIRYQLDVEDSQDSVIELQDVICLLKDKKELYIQKDHLSEQLDICRELVKLFCDESSHRKELNHFLSGLIASLSDPRALKRFLGKEDIQELPSEEEQWEVPEPRRLELPPDTMLYGTTSSTSPEEAAGWPAQEDGEQTLMCWPPRASLLNLGTSRTAAHPDSGAVEAAMKMWPPPALPKDRDPEREGAPRASAHEEDQHLRGPGGPGSRSADHPRPQSLHPVQPGTPANGPTSTLANASKSTTANGSSFIPQSPELRNQGDTTQSDRVQHVEVNTGGSRPATPAPPPAASPAQAAEDQPAAALNSLSVPDAVLLSSTFQGATASQRPPLNLDFPAWPHQAALEDIELTCQRPSTVVLSDDQTNMVEIGDWGERLVFSFLCHWRDGGDPRRPAEVQWCNQSGESGQPYDFRLTFSQTGAVYVEVKSTVKREKAFIHLSANELDFALKEKERYHLFRVYSAGDAQNVRLCRIRNLAQHLHTKDVGLFLFV